MKPSQLHFCLLSIIVTTNAQRYLVASDMKQYFIKEIILKLQNNPNQIAVDLPTNALYFSFDSGEEEYVPAIFYMTTKKLTVLSGVSDAFAIGNNSTSGEVFFGGSFGIYKYNTINKTLKKLAKHNLDVWSLFIHKSDIYFTKFPHLQVFRYADRKVEPVRNLVGTPLHHFLLDFYDNMFFINGSGLYITKIGDREVRLVNNEHNFVTMAIDHRGKIYLGDYRAIYILKEDLKLLRVVSVPSVFAMTFDKDNHLIYTNSHEFVRLVPYRCFKEVKNG